MYNVEINLFERVPYIVDSEKVNHQMNEKPLSRNKVFCIPRFKREKGYGEHAILIRSFYNIESTIDDRNLDYQLSVSAKHGLTNITRVISQKYRSSKCIHNGANFTFGKGLGVNKKS